MSTNLKMFVLVRSDLEEIHQSVQSGHSLAEYSLRGDKGLYQQWDNHSLIYLGVSDEWALLKWTHKLKKKEKCFSGFYEPDLQNELTAVACIDTGEIFKNLPLVRWR